jgi:hypothetical protein
MASDEGQEIMIIIISPFILIVFAVALALTIGAHVTVAALITMLAIVVTGAVLAAFGLSYLHHRWTSPVRAAVPAWYAEVAAARATALPHAERATAAIAAARAMGIELDSWQVQVLTAAYMADGPLYQPALRLDDLQGTDHPELKRGDA